MNSTIMIYYILINTEGKAIVIDYRTNTDKCDSGIGYETNIDAWMTDKTEYMDGDCIFFDSKNVFQKPGIYEVDGYVDVLCAPEGCYYDFKVLNVDKISDLPYIKKIEKLENSVKVLRTYSEWCPILEKENEVKIIDDDGGRQLNSEGKLDKLMSKEKAFKYFCICTVSGIKKNK